MVKTKLKKIFRIIAYVLLISVAFYNTTLIIKSVVNRNETPSFFGIKSFVVVSGSMEPNIEIGDYIFVKSINPKDIKVGDIISFRSGNSIVTHRIIEIIDDNNEIKYKTRGDNNNTEDKELVPSSAIEGKYVRKISKVGKIILALNNKIVLIMILILLYLIIRKGLNNNEKIVNEDKIIEKKENVKKPNNRNKIVVLIYFLVISTVLLTTFSFAKYKGTWSTEKTARVARWEVYADTSDNDSDILDAVIGNDDTNPSYILKITSTSEVRAMYSINITDLPDGIEIKLDDGDYILEENNMISFDDVGIINADAEVNNRTITHTLTFNFPIDIDEINNNQVNINVMFNQVD